MEVDTISAAVAGTVCDTVTMGYFNRIVSLRSKEVASQRIRKFKIGSERAGFADDGGAA